MTSTRSGWRPGGGVATVCPRSVPRAGAWSRGARAVETQSRPEALGRQYIRARITGDGHVPVEGRRMSTSRVTGPEEADAFTSQHGQPCANNPGWKRPSWGESVVASSPSSPGRGAPASAPRSARLWVGAAPSRDCHERVGVAAAAHGRRLTMAHRGPTAAARVRARLQRRRPSPSWAVNILRPLRA